MYSILEGSLGSPSQPCIKSWKTLKEFEQKVFGFYEIQKGRY